MKVVPMMHTVIVCSNTRGGMLQIKSNIDSICSIDIIAVISAYNFIVSKLINSPINK